MDRTDNFDPAVEVQRIRSWLSEWGKNLECFVIGLSGGIDSSVTAVLCSEVKKTYGVMLPCHSRKESLVNAEALIEKFMIVPMKIDLGSTHAQLKKNLDHALGREMSIYPDGNMRARLRAVTLYGIANEFHGVVIGTDNKVENYLGYFTKGGDGLVDCNPLGEYYKNEIYRIAEFLDVPQQIIDAAPSADLGISENDESELGFPYSELEKAISHILGEQTLQEEEVGQSAVLLKRVRDLHESTEHKRELPPSCPRN